jgi:hypothetical protein
VSDRKRASEQASESGSEAEKAHTLRLLLASGTMWRRKKEYSEST